jgi:parvulin-like peptidyl-prolyl isomerase
MVRDLLIRFVFLSALMLSAVIAEESSLKALARVGSDFIYFKDLERELKGRLEYIELFKKGIHQVDKSILTQLVDRLIDRNLLIAFGNQSGFVDEERVSKMLTEFVNKMGGAKIAEERLTSYGIDWQSWRKNMSDDIRVILIGEAISKNLRSPSAEEVSKFVDANANTIYDPPRANLSVIVIGSSNELREESKLISFVQQLREKPEDFANQARRYSDGSSAQQGGELGYFAKGALTDDVEEKISKLQVGEISDPISYGDKKFIFKVNERKGGKLDDAGKNEIARENIIIKMGQEKIESILARLRSKTEIEKYKI